MDEPRDEEPRDEEPRDEEPRDEDLPPSEAARARRRDHDASAHERAGMRTGLAKGFKQILDAQVKRARAPRATRKEPEQPDETERPERPAPKKPWRQRGVP